MDSKVSRVARPGFRPELPLLLIALCGLLAPACSQSQAKPDPGKAAATRAAEPAAPALGAQQQPAAGQGAAAAAGEEAEDGDAPAQAPAAAEEVLTDEQGRKYVVRQLPKEEGRYRRLEDGRIHTIWGIPIELVREDDRFFYYKSYKVERLPDPPKGPSEEEIAKVEATYRSETAESDRLRFVPFSQGLPDSGQWRNGFDVADMNKDGHLDIVHGPARKSLGPPSIFLGDGKGGWRLWKEARYQSFPYDYGDARAADLNRDGHQDLVLGIHLRGVTALLGDSKGTFTLWNKGLEFDAQGGPAFSSRAIEVVDWNGDRRPDILALGEGPRLAQMRGGEREPATTQEASGILLYLNQGDGTWKKEGGLTGPGRIHGDSITLGDFDGDGRQDFATGSNAMERNDLVNLRRKGTAWETVALDLMRPRSYVRGVAAADFDKDGRDDLVLGIASAELDDWKTVLDVLFSRPGGKWTRRTILATEGREGITAVDAGDLDGDRKPDLVALTGDGKTLVFLGDGKGGFAREATDEIAPFAGGCRGYHIQLADFDRDGRDELAAGFAGESNAMFAPDRCTSGGGLQAWDAVAAQPKRTK